MDFSAFSAIEGSPKFEYVEAKTIAEACSLLSQYKEKAKVIAGGTRLLASMKKGEVSPEFVINLKSIPNLAYINYGESEGLMIGALTTLSEVESSPIVRAKFSIVAQAAQERERPASIEGRWIQYMATIGGNLCSAVSSADMAISLIALGAKAKIQGLKGWQAVPLEEFFTGPSETILQSGEILSEIQVPKQPADTGVVYMKLPVAKDVPDIAVAVLLTLDAKHVNIAETKIVLGAKGAAPIRARSAENVIKGKAIDEKLIKKVAQAASEEAGSQKNAIQELIDKAVRQAIDDAIGDFAMGY